MLGQPVKTTVVIVLCVLAVTSMWLLPTFGRGGGAGGAAGAGRGVAQGAVGARAPTFYKQRIDAHWFANNTRFWYRNDLKGGAKEFVLVVTDATRRGRRRLIMANWRRR